MPEENLNNENDAADVQKADENATALENIYNEYNIESNSDVAEQNSSTTEIKSTPDKAVANTDSQVDLNQVLQKVETIESNLSQQQADAERKALDTDIKHAVSAVNEIAKLPRESFVQGHLAELYATDPRFKAAFDNRGQNPQAFKAVIKAVGEDLHKSNNFIPADQIESDRNSFEHGMNSPSNTGLSAEQQELGEKLDGMSDNQFDNYMNNLARQV